MSRTRDVDTSVRKLVYPLLERRCLREDGEPGIGVTHPRILTISQRELIVRNGLGDREDIVKDAARKLLGTWVDVVRADGAKQENDAGVRGDLLAFLKLFDLAEGNVGEDALMNVFKTRTELFESVDFEGSCFWVSSLQSKYQ